jgi:hypothetical protein
MLKHSVLVGFAASWSLASSVVAQPTAGKSAANYNSGDRSERICEKITPVGSRLASKMFCGTRAEWEEKRRQDREEVEKVQKNPCVRHAGC